MPGLALRDLGLIALLVLVLYLLARRQPRASQPDPALTLMQQQMDAFRQQIGEGLTQLTGQVNQQLASITQQLHTTTGQIGNRLDQSATAVGEVQRGLGELSKATAQIMEVGRDISQLQDILRAPKLRGGLGELMLGDLLAQILPAPHFTLQHTFRGGETVDAVIRLSNRLVPVDAKFPLENFRRTLGNSTEEEKRTARRKFLADVKKHIDTIASKYILPDEGTFDFALMYIPAENVYYEVIIKDEELGGEASLLSYAFRHKVMPVSPNSFYAYLNTILLGLRGMEISEKAQVILGHLSRLQVELEKFQREFEKVGSHLTDARNRYEDAAKRLVRFGDKLGGLEEQSSASGGGSGEQLPLV